MDCNSLSIASSHAHPAMYTCTSSIVKQPSPNCPGETSSVSLSPSPNRIQIAANAAAPTALDRIDPPGKHDTFAMHMNISNDEFARLVEENAFDDDAVSLALRDHFGPSTSIMHCNG